MTIPDRSEALRQYAAAERLSDALQRIQGIADADGGRFLSEYGFATVKDALFEARQALDALAAELAETRRALAWALGRVAMPGCRCSTGSDGPCTCDRESWPEYKELRKAQALASGSAADPADSPWPRPPIEPGERGLFDRAAGSAAEGRRGVRREYEHTQALRDAKAAVTTLRNRIRKLHWIAGGKGYDNMGKRELDNARNHADEAAFWIAAASRSLNAGAQRYEALSADQPPEGDALTDDRGRPDPQPQ